MFIAIQIGFDERRTLFNELIPECFSAAPFPVSSSFCKAKIRGLVFFWSPCAKSGVRVVVAQNSKQTKTIRTFTIISSKALGPRESKSVISPSPPMSGANQRLTIRPAGARLMTDSSEGPACAPLHRELN